MKMSVKTTYGFKENEKKKGKKEGKNSTGKD
jgi:hypothetical protein